MNKSLSCFVFFFFIPQSIPRGRKERRAAPAPPHPRCRSGRSFWWIPPTSCVDWDEGRCSPSGCCRCSPRSWRRTRGKCSPDHWSLVFDNHVGLVQRDSPVGVHADLSFDGDVQSWPQSFQDTASVREALKWQHGTVDANDIELSLCGHKMATFSLTWLQTKYLRYSERCLYILYIWHKKGIILYTQIYIHIFICLLIIPFLCHRNILILKVFQLLIFEWAQTRQPALLDCSLINEKVFFSITYFFPMKNTFVIKIRQVQL